MFAAGLYSYQVIPRELRYDISFDHLARRLVDWASRLAPSREDLELAARSLRDTLAVTIAARNDDICAIVAECPEPLRPGSTDSGGMIEIHH